MYSHEKTRKCHLPNKFNPSTKSYMHVLCIFLQILYFILDVIFSKIRTFNCNITCPSGFVKALRTWRRTGIFVTCYLQDFHTGEYYYTVKENFEWKRRKLKKFLIFSSSVKYLYLFNYCRWHLNYLYIYFQIL